MKLSRILIWYFQLLDYIGLSYYNQYMKRKFDIELCKAVGARLKLLRKEWKLNQVQMADRIKVSESSYSKYEKGEVFLNYWSMELLLKEYNVSSDWLLFGKGPRHFMDKPDQEKVMEETAEPLKNRIAELETALSELQGRCETQSQDISNLKSEVETLTVSKESIGSQLEEATTRLTEAESKLGELSETGEDVRKMVVEMNRTPLLRYEMLAQFQRFKRDEEKE